MSKTTVHRYNQIFAFLARSFASTIVIFLVFTIVGMFIRGMFYGEHSPRNIDQWTACWVTGMKWISLPVGLYVLGLLVARGIDQRKRSS